MKQKHHFQIGNDMKLEKRPIQNNGIMANDNWTTIAKYSSIGYYIVTPLIMGVFFGLLIDKLIKSSPNGVLFGLIIGTLATFYNLFKLTKE